MSKLSYPFYKIVLLCLVLFFVSTQNQAQVVHRGLVYLPNNMIEGNKLANISGEWQFYYGKHLSAKEMKNLPIKDKHYIINPENWKGLEINGQKLPSFGIATYYLQLIKKPPLVLDSASYGLHIGNITSAYSLWVNNCLIDQIGKPGIKEKEFKPIYLPHSFYFQANTDTVDIVLQVSNFFDPNYAGISQPIYFGKSNAIELFTLERNTLAGLVLSAFILLFIHQVVLSITNKAERSHIIIALLCVVFFVKVLLDGDLVIFHFFRDLDFKLCYRAWLLSMLSIPLITKLLELAFPKEVNSTVAKGIYLFYLVFLLLVLTANLTFLLNHVFVVIYISFACIGYLFYVLTKAVINHRNYAIIHIISFTIMLLSFVNDLVFVTNQHTFGYLSQVGVSLYILIQTIIISIKFARYHRQTIDLSHKLELANQTLESTVQQRTIDLQTANVALSKISRQKDFLLSTITHDLINSFNTLLTFTKTLSKDDSLSEKHRSLMAMLYRASDKGYSILDNMLTWAKLQVAYKPVIKPITLLSYIINENIRLQADPIESKDIHIEITIDDSLLFCCDEGHLHTILRNLLSNAIKFSNKGGSIRFSNQVKNGWVQVLIQDEGVGMSHELYQSLFDSTNNKKREGTEGEKGAGLGLLIIKELIENNLGKISCSSNTDEGTVFLVEFKLFEKQKLNEKNINH